MEKEEKAKKSKAVGLIPPDWYYPVIQAINEEHDGIVGSLCTLIEAAIPNEKQCIALKKTLKGTIRTEQRALIVYLWAKAFPKEDTPTEYNSPQQVANHQN